MQPTIPDSIARIAAEVEQEQSSLQPICSACGTPMVELRETMFVCPHCGDDEHPHDYQNGF